LLWAHEAQGIARTQIRNKCFRMSTPASRNFAYTFSFAKGLAEVYYLAVEIWQRSYTHLACGDFLP
jgi:hypothetical protein